MVELSGSSYFFNWLKGKCRYCRKPIGLSAILLEVVLALALVASYLWWPFGFTNFADWLLFGLWVVSLAMLAILFVYDARHYLLPDVVMWPLVAVGVGIFVLRALDNSWTLPQSLLELGLGFLPVTGIYGVLYALSGGKWIGFGDVKLGLFIGLLLGWQGALLVIMLANLLGCFYIIPGMDILELLAFIWLASHYR